MSVDYYDRDGRPIEDMLKWAKLLGDQAYKRVALTTLPNGMHVSTVWLGLDHNFSGVGPPLIFETMVFPPDSYAEHDMERYATEADARAGHAQMVEKWLARDLPGYVVRERVRDEEA